MTGNISKAKGFRGEDGKTPSVVLLYDPDSGNLYYSSDGIMVDKDYVNSQNLISKDEAIVFIDEKTKIIEFDLEGLKKQINEEAHFRGYLSTNAKIQAMPATPNDFAYSAESGTKWVYDAELGWQDTGKPVPNQLIPASDATPLVDGVASAGQSEEYARGDHRHPTDTTRLSVAEFNEFKSELENSLDNIITKYGLGGVDV